MRLQFNGFWYGEAYGTAADPGYCVSPLAGTFVRTERRDVPTAPYRLLYTRGRQGTFAGQDAGGRGNVEVTPDGTARVVGDGYGVNTVLYLRDGTLVQGAPPFGSQGLRYQADDGRIVTADQSHLSPDHVLADYTEVGGVRIGQNQDGAGALVQINGALRLLEPGDCQFIRVNYDAASDSFAIGIVKLPEQRWVGYWLTRAELAALPLFATAPPQNPPPVDPPKPPAPPKEPPVTIAVVPDYSSLVDSLKPSLPLAELNRLNDIADSTRAAKGEDHPDTQAAEVAVNQVKGACAQTIVAALNAKEGRQDWGCLRKDAGQHWTRSDGTNLSTDIAFNRVLLRLVDVMGDRKPSWDVHPPEDQQPVEKFVLPLVAGPAVDPPKPPPTDPPKNPPPAAPPVDAVTHAELDALRADLDKRIAALEMRPSPAPDLTAYAKHGDPIEASARVFGLSVPVNGKIK